LFGSIAVWLGAVGLDKSRTGGFARVVIEKPFGSGEQRARELNAEISSVFAEDQVFRVDHYLATETVQNLLAVRFANAIFEPIWNDPEELEPPPVRVWSTWRQSNQVVHAVRGWAVRAAAATNAQRPKITWIRAEPTDGVGESGVHRAQARRPSRS